MTCHHVTFFRQKIELHTNLSFNPANDVAKNAGGAMLARAAEIGMSGEGLFLVSETDAKLLEVLEETSFSCLCQKDVSLI